MTEQMREVRFAFVSIPPETATVCVQYPKYESDKLDM